MLRAPVTTISGEVNSDKPAVRVFGVKTEFGAVSLKFVTVAKLTPAPDDETLQPFGICGTDTPSKFSL